MLNVTITRGLACCLASLLAAPVLAGTPFEVVPARATLRGNFARTQLVVHPQADGSQRSDRAEDLSRAAGYATLDPSIVTVNDSGQLLARGNGSTSVAVTVEGTVRYVAVEVSDVVDRPEIGFKEQVRPILSKHGCNMGACHAAQHGKGGFKLSIFGYNPSNDRRGIVRDRHQRRVSFVRPAQSLFLLKPTLQVPHGGGQRLQRTSVDHDILVFIDLELVESAGDVDECIVTPGIGTSLADHPVSSTQRDDGPSTRPIPGINDLAGERVSVGQGHVGDNSNWTRLVAGRRFGSLERNARSRQQDL